MSFLHPVSINPVHLLVSMNVNLDLCPSECPDDLLCTEDEVLELLLSIDTSKASGPDGISGKML